MFSTSQNIITVWLCRRNRTEPNGYRAKEVANDVFNDAFSTA
jgi:hypothetical protein